MVFGLGGLRDLVGYVHGADFSDVFARLASRGSHGQDLGLVMRDVAQYLAGRVESDLVVVLFAFLFGHAQVSGWVPPPL